MKEANQKFVLGLSFERAGLSKIDGIFMKSGTALEICNQAVLCIENHPETEHEFYRIGEKAFQSSTDDMKKNLSPDERKVRYHHLVRLGGDIMRSPLADYPKATILGSLVKYSENNRTL